MGKRGEKGAISNTLSSPLFLPVSMAINHTRGFRALSGPREIVATF